MKTLELFNAVIAKESDEKPYVDDRGYVIAPNALWAKDRIIAYYEKLVLNGVELNKTFHKSWQTIKDTPREELFVAQIMHYLSTYGSDFRDEVYIPQEICDAHELKTKVVFKVIKGYTKEEMIEKCLSLLKSGVAMKEETIDDVLSILDELDYTFTGEEGIRNKEAVIKIADLYGVLPYDLMEFFRYIVYRATGSTLLIKDKESIQKIKESGFNPTVQFKKFGLERLAEIFNRYKPLFLAFKKKCPKVINKISKLSKQYHKPMVVNPLNEATHEKLKKADERWLDNATPYALFKALNACYTRMKGQDCFVYRIRNGKSFAKENEAEEVNAVNFKYIMRYIKKRFDFSEKKIFLPEDVEYALPTSEKMYVGDIPTGTKFFGMKLAVGIYWEDKWGARDLDLSGQNIMGKVGWNSTYNQSGDLLYSGDLTSAPQGAVEYLYANSGLQHPTLIKNNVYLGENDCEFKIIVGKGEKMSRTHMMNPDNRMLDVKVQSVQKQSILGILIPEMEGQSFVLLNFGAGHARVSGNSEVSEIATKALYQQWKNALNLRYILEECGAEIVEEEEEADINLSLNQLEKDTFIKLFEEKK